VQLVGLEPPAQVVAHLPPAPLFGTHQLQPEAAPQVAQLVLFRQGSDGQVVSVVAPPPVQVVVPPTTWHDMPTFVEQARHTVALKFDGPFSPRHPMQVVCVGQTASGLLAQLPAGVL